MPQYERPAHSRLLEMRLESKNGSKKKKKAQHRHPMVALTVHEKSTPISDSDIN